MNIKNILFIQDTPPCVRTIKIATVLSGKGVNIHLMYNGKYSANNINEIFTSLNKLKFFNKMKIKQIRSFIDNNNIQLIHYHNEPDNLCANIINANFSIPIIYDQHDYLSPKRTMKARDLVAEKVCNEKADGNIYITEKYKDLVGERYKTPNKYLILPNLLLLNTIPKKLKEKFSKHDGKIHLVYIGLITQHKNKIRNLVEHFTMLSSKGFIIHVYPTRKKSYPIYEQIPNLIMHEQLPINKLLIELSSYDFGILFLNMESVSKEEQDELKNGAWNKFYDYLSAGIPSITLSSYEYMQGLVKNNHLGVVYSDVSEINNKSLNDFDKIKFIKSLEENRTRFSMDSKADDIISLYKQSLSDFRV